MFIQGAASSSSDTLPPSLPPRLASALLANVVCDPLLLEPQPGSSGCVAGAQKRRGQAQSDSDMSKRHKGGVTGKLLDMRTQALAAIKRACQQHGAAKNNMVARWQALVTAGNVRGSSAPPEMASWVATVKQTLAELAGPAKQKT